MNQPPEWERRYAPWLYGALFFAVLYGLFLSASISRPIWIDEFVNFAMGAATSLADAWFIVERTTPAVNHGHTGAYLLYSYLSLSQFGANSIVLRAPAMLSGALLMFFSVYFFRILGLSIAWQFLAVLALFGQSLVVYFIGEARTYMPLTAAVVGLLAYYTGRAHGFDSRTLRMIGIASAVLGVAMSPYIAIYWPAVAMVGYFSYLLENQHPPRLKTLLSFINFPLVAISIVGFFVIGAFTWMRGSPIFSYDPLQWIRTPSVWVHILDYSHLQFLSRGKPAAIILTVLAIGFSLFFFRKERRRLGRLLAPILLLAATATVSAILAYASYRMNYWILGRQFTASAALVALGVIWLWAEAARLLAPRSGLAGVAIGLTAAFIVLGQVRRNHDTQWLRLRAEAEAQAAIRAGMVCMPPTTTPQGLPIQEGNDAWVAAANRNIQCGGPVWPLFRTYYDARP